MVDVERDILKAKEGEGDELVYKTITGLKADLSVESKPVLLRSEHGAPEPGKRTEFTPILLYYQITDFLLSLIEFNHTAEDQREQLADGAGDDDDEEDDEDSDSDSDGDDSRFKSSARPKDESTDDKKQRKKAIKDAKAEKRKNKIPKHVKRRKERQGTKKK